MLRRRRGPPPQHDSEASRPPETGPRDRECKWLWRVGGLWPSGPRGGRAETSGPGSECGDRSSAAIAVLSESFRSESFPDAGERDRYFGYFSNWFFSRAGPRRGFGNRQRNDSDGLLDLRNKQGKIHRSETLISNMHNRTIVERTRIPDVSCH